jgi:hypothetical protein
MNRTGSSVKGHSRTLGQASGLSAESPASSPRLKSRRRRVVDSAPVREAFDRLLRDRPVVAVALGVALGWSLIQVAAGVAAVVTGLLTKNDFTGYAGGGVLTWEVGGRILTFGTLVVGLVQLAVVLAVALFVFRERNVKSDVSET